MRSKILAMAKLKAKKKPDAKKPMTVDGSAARPRLDRPGRMKRAEGGSVDDGKPFNASAEAKRLRDEAGKERWAGAGSAAMGTIMALTGTGGKAIGRALKYTGVPLNFAASAVNHHAAGQKEDAADRLERAEDGKEDRRKSGGRVKR